MKEKMLNSYSTFIQTFISINQNIRQSLSQIFRTISNVEQRRFFCVNIRGYVAIYTNNLSIFIAYFALLRTCKTRQGMT